MVETFTPAVCGSRKRQRLALLGFGIGALATSALVGATLGTLGTLLGVELALVAAGLALLAALREAGILRLRLPQSRKQVPERWRAVLPLPVWSVGYGAGLGAGFLTFQPISTFWVACAAALALGRPVPAAACFTAYGAGRTVMAIVPRRGKQDATAAVEGLVRRRRVLLGANVFALLVCAALLSAPAAGAATTVGQGYDPAARSSVLARTQMNAGGPSVLVEPEGEGAVAIRGGASPAVDGELLAYADDEGIKVINWRTEDRVARIDGAVSRPALDWPLLAFVRTGTRYKRLIVADLTDAGAPSQRRIASARIRDDLGRPALAAGRVAWHKVTQRDSRVIVLWLETGRRRIIARSVIRVESNPSLTARRILWVEQRPRSASLFVRRFGHRGTREIYRLVRRDRSLLTTALTRRVAYVTRWTAKSRDSTLIRVNF